MNSDASHPTPPVTIDEIVACVLGQASLDVSDRVRAAVESTPRCAELFNTITTSVRLMRDDVQFEPPPACVTRAIGLSSALRSREPSRARSIGIKAALGAIFDRAGAHIFEWLNPDGELAFAGLRDDRGNDVISLESPDINIAVRAERVTGQDGVVKIIGEVLRSDGTPLRTQLLVLDANARVLAVDESDSLGMFLVTLVPTAHELVFTALSDGAGNTMKTCVLTLGPRSSS